MDDLKVSYNSNKKGGKLFQGETGPNPSLWVSQTKSLTTFPLSFKELDRGGSTDDDRTDLDPQGITLRLRPKGGGELLIQKPVQVALMTGNHISQQSNRIYNVGREIMTA